MNQYKLFNMISKVVIIYFTTEKKEFALDISHEHGLALDKITGIAKKELKDSNKKIKYKIEEIIIKSTEPALK